MNASPRIFIADHDSMLGNALVRQLRRQEHPADKIITRSPQALDLTDQAAVQALFLAERPQQVFLPLPGLHGGALAQQPQGEQFLALQLALSHVIGAARRTGVQRLVFIGSAHVYPPQTIVPRAEEDLLRAPPAVAHEGLALAQIAALRLCHHLGQRAGQPGGLDCRSLISAPVFGPGDHFFSPQAGSIARLIHRLHSAKERDETVVHIHSRRHEAHEFIAVQDLAGAACHLMALDTATYRTRTLRGIGHLNAGYGRECSLPALADSVAGIVGYRGRIECHLPAGEPHTAQLLDSHRLRSTGWRPLLTMEDAIALAYCDYLARSDHLAQRAQRAAQAAQAQPPARTAPATPAARHGSLQPRRA
jgi:GDP-L-fucose synthase